MDIPMINPLGGDIPVTQPLPGEGSTRGANPDDYQLSMSSNTTQSLAGEGSTFGANPDDFKLKFEPRKQEPYTKKPLFSDLKLEPGQAAVDAPSKYGNVPIMGDARAIIEATEPFAEPTQEEYNARLLRVSNELTVQRQQAHAQKQADKAKRAGANGLATGSMGKTMVVSQNPYASREELDNVAHVLDSLNGDSDKPITMDEYRRFENSMTRSLKPGAKFTKTARTGLTSEAEKVLYNAKRYMSESVTSGVESVKARLASIDKPTNVMDWNSLIDQVAPRNVSDIVRAQVAPLMPKELMVAENEEALNFPLFSRWYTQKTGGISTLLLAQLKTNPFIRDAYDEFKSANIPYSWHSDGENIEQFKPSASLMKLEDDEGQIAIASHRVANGFADISDPIAAKIYKDNGAGEAISGMKELYSIDPKSYATGKLTGKSARGISSDAVKAISENAMDYYGGKPGTLSNAISKALAEARESNLVSGLESPDAMVATAADVMSQISMVYNARKAETEKAIARAQALDDSLVSDRLVKQVGKNREVSELFKKIDRTPDIRTRMLSGTFDEIEYANDIIRNALSIDPNSRQGRRLETGLHQPDLNVLSQTNPDLAKVIGVIRNQVKEDAYAVTKEESAGKIAQDRVDYLRKFNAQSSIPANIPFQNIEFGSDNKPTRAFRPTYIDENKVIHKGAESIMDMQKNPAIPVDIKSQALAMSGQGISRLDGKTPIYGISEAGITNAEILSAPWSGSMDRMYADGWADKKSIADLSAATSASVTTGGRATPVKPDSKYWEKASPVARSLWNEGQLLKEKSTSYDEGSKKMTAAFMLMRKDYIEAGNKGVVAIDELITSDLSGIEQQFGFEKNSLTHKNGEPVKLKDSLIKLVALTSNDPEANLKMPYSTSFLAIDDGMKRLSKSITDMKDIGNLPPATKELVSNRSDVIDTWKRLKAAMIANKYAYYQ